MLSRELSRQLLLALSKYGRLYQVRNWLPLTSNHLHSFGYLLMRAFAWFRIRLSALHR
jgi:hypothetical protein